MAELVSTNENNVTYADKLTMAQIRLNVGLVFQKFQSLSPLFGDAQYYEAQMHVLKTPKQEAQEIARALK